MCDEEQPVLSAGCSSYTGTAFYMMDGGLCFCWCHMGSKYSTAVEEVHHKPECHVYVQPKEVCHVLFLWGYRQFDQSHLSSQDTFFFPAAFWENVWFDMAFYRVDKADARLAFPPCMQDSKLCLAAEHLVEGHPTSGLSG